MNPTFPVRPKRLLSALAVVACFYPMSYVYAESKTIEQLEREVAELKEANRQQEARLQSLEARFNRLAVASPSTAVAVAQPQPGATAGGQPLLMPISPPPAGRATAQVAQTTPQNLPPTDESAAGANRASTTTIPTVSELPKSVGDIYQEASGFSSASRYTLEADLTYSHYDVRQMTLNGFLALDAIFLGNIDIDRISSDILTLDLIGRYSPSPRWQFEVDTPFVARSARYFSGGVGGSTAAFSEVDQRQGPRLGDVSFAVAYKVVQEDETWPDIVASMRVRAPTGDEPYGIKLVTEKGNNNLSYPSKMATGTGLWSLNPTVSFVKTVDPAVLFASLTYTYYFASDFDDISASEGIIQPGSVQLGSIWGFGVGTAFALNDRLSLGLSYSQQIGSASRTKIEGGEWQDISGSKSNVAVFNVGMTYALNKHLSIVPNLAIGLTPDTADYAVSVKFPYNF